MGPKSAKSAKYRVFCGYTWKTPGIPGKYPATAWVSCRFPQFCVRFCPRPALRLRETREFPEWSTKHPLFSLEISGNAKCWGPSVYVIRIQIAAEKSLARRNRRRPSEVRAPALARACSRARLLSLARARGALSRACSRLLARVCLVLPGPFCAPCSDVQVSALPQAAMMETKETNQSGAMKTLLVVTAAFGAQNHSALFPPHAPCTQFVLIRCRRSVCRHARHTCAGPSASAQGVVRRG